MYKALQQVSYPHEALKKLTCPVLCLVGSEDPMNLPAWSRQVAAVLPNAQVLVYRFPKYHFLNGCTDSKHKPSEEHHIHARFVHHGTRMSLRRAHSAWRSQ